MQNHTPPPSQSPEPPPERRAVPAGEKNFILTYYLETEPAVKYKVTQLKYQQGRDVLITSQNTLR